MATTTCGWCGRDVHMTQLQMRTERTIWGTYQSDAAYECNNPKCARYSVVTWATRNDPADHLYPNEPEDTGDNSVRWNPPPVKRPDFPDVPSHIANAAREAWLCHAHAAYIASSATARSVIEAAAKSFNITARGIEPKIVALAEKKLIWGDLVASAHLVRQFGNDAAHGDLVTPVTASEAEDVLDIMDALLHQLFTTPARARRLEASRQQRRG